MRRSLLLPTTLAIALACAASAHAQVDQTTKDVETERQTAGNRVTENVPAIPPELVDTLNSYQNTRGASVAGWLADDCLLVSTRFAETAQAHRVCAPLGMREQITFYPEPVAGLATMPVGTGKDGFVFGKDKGGDEFSQLYWYDLATREATLLTDGKRSQNRGALFSDDGKQLAYSSTARNGQDTDVWMRDIATGQSRAVVTDGGSWSALDFSPDGKRLLVAKYVSINEAYPGEVDLASGKLTLFPVDGGKAAFGGFEYAPDGRSVYFVSDEPVAGKPSEFRTLRYHNPASGEPPQELSGDIPWDVEDFTVADDGRHLAYVSNEDGIAKLRVLSLPRHREIRLPELPVGLVGGLAFSPDGKRLAVTLNTSTSPSDTYVIDLASAKLTRWTRSEVGGLDASKFVTPMLVRYPTFDQADGGVSGNVRRTIPAFYYKPTKASAGGKVPVVIQIHGGPEGQSQPGFSPVTQYLVNELGVAVIAPNVRGSSGYGKSYLLLDNADKREDSVKDIGALLDWIAGQPELDATRVGVSGGSYGGYMVLATMTNYPERIRAGVDVVGISHFGTFLKNTESYRRDLRRAEYGDERDPAMQQVFERISPLNNARKIAAPLFVAQGRNDPRVPYTEAEQIVKAVRGSGEPVWFLMFDDEGHGFRKKANTDYFTAASVLFWQQHLLAKDE